MPRWETKKIAWGGDIYIYRQTSRLYERISLGADSLKIKKKKVLSVYFERSGLQNRANVSPNFLSFSANKMVVRTGCLLF